ncbi:MAG: cytochrome c peroxidase [Flavobacteriales bacterium]
MVILISIGCISCEHEELNPSAPDSFSLTRVPAGFPEIPFPEENTFSMAKWNLGRKLFYDTRLSIDGSMSCGSCHDASIAFSDDVAMSNGVQGTIGTRNAPSIANMAYLPYYTREGGVPTLEMQVLIPIQEHNEFNHNIVDIAEQLTQDTAYARMSMNAFDRPIDPYVITRSIATFERTIVSGNSAYDKYKYQGNSMALNEQQKLGLNLFNSERTNCSACHSDFNFSNYTFQNNGLYESYIDPGRFRLTLDSADMALFKVPSLRNVAITAPYMHDGSMQSLEEVVKHYNEGGKNHPHKSEFVKPLGLTPNEMQAIVSFLETLTDYELISNEFFKDE